MKTELNFKLFNLINGTNKDACINENGVFLSDNEGDYRLEITPITRSDYSQQWSIACDLADHQEICHGFFVDSETGKIHKCDRCSKFLTDQIAERYANEITPYLKGKTK